MARKQFKVKYHLKDKKTGRSKSYGQIVVPSESETNAIAHVKKLYQQHEVEILAVTPM